MAPLPAAAMARTLLPLRRGRGSERAQLAVGTAGLQGLRQTLRRAWLVPARTASIWVV